MESKNFVNLNVNPCKMCMPLGAVTAFKGIENSMMILHGSQGCSTYIRRHMAGHYNEPIDIASSSLNEEGTVYGGESNLIKGLDNVIKLYNPSIIGVATTCLAETIGEDIKRIINKYYEQKNSDTIIPSIIPVSTAGYAGTQFEGFYSAVFSIVQNLVTEKRSGKKINIIAGNLNPGDIRNIKSIIEQFTSDYLILPDISDTLDAPYAREYSKIPEGGTKIKDIQGMSGACATIELGVCIPEKLSCAAYLNEKFGVPFYRCPYPIGIEATDNFINLLSKITGLEIPETFVKERGRYIDAMIDSHKHNSEGRAVIYGEPDIVYSMTKLCSENGIKPVFACTGTQSEEMIEALNGIESNDDLNIIDDVDFHTIQQRARELEANLLIGNSDGKIITEKEGIPLVRVGFPIHDRVGGQRQIITGFNGSLMLLDRLTNTLLENKYEKYRRKMFKKYFIKIAENEPAAKIKIPDKPEPESVQNILNAEAIKGRTQEHPCFGAGACKNARMHIPVAPKCNVTCNYCSRKYDCVNESRPGVTSEVLTPEKALEKFILVKEKVANLKVIGIAGPGDALANFDETKRSLELIRDNDPDITFCLSTNGLMLPKYADEIIRLGVTHVTVTVNAVDPQIGAKIYKQINYKGQQYYGVEGAEILLKNQLEGIKYLTLRGIVCKINIVMIKGINDTHIEDIVKKVKELGVYITNIMPLIPAQGSAFENMPLTSNKELTEMRRKCGEELMQMYHCRQCRADAIGTLDNDCSGEFAGCSSSTPKNDTPKYLGTYTFAIATKSGMLVDEHFGHVSEFYIYRTDGKRMEFIERKSVDKYCTGEQECDEEENRIKKIISTVKDYDAVLVLRIGYRPLKALEEAGVKVFQTCGSIESCIKEAAVKLLNSRAAESAM